MMAKQGTPKAAVAKQAAFYARAADLERPVVLRGLAAGGRLLVRPGRVR